MAVIRAAPALESIESRWAFDALVRRLRAEGVAGEVRALIDVECQLAHAGRGRWRRATRGDGHPEHESRHVRHRIGGVRLVFVGGTVIETCLRNDVKRDVAMEEPVARPVRRPDDVAGAPLAVGVGHFKRLLIGRNRRTGQTGADGRRPEIEAVHVHRVPAGRAVDDAPRRLRGP